jgi:2-dehydropantoate 2-reductase
VAASLKVGVFGAGAIGCYIGGKLAASGVDVVFVARARTKAELEADGLTAIDLDGTEQRVPKERLVVATEASALADCDVVLVCVKSAQTAEAAATLPRGPLVVSMQNGVRNPETLRERLGQEAVLGGIVGFNVVSKGGGRFRRGTSGSLVIEASRDERASRLRALLRSCGFVVEVPDDIRAVQWSKLIINLNNAVSALSGRPTREILSCKRYRRALAATIAEALTVLGRAHIRPAKLGAIPVALFPHVLRLPSPLFHLVARAQLKVDPEARSSMWEDLTRGRVTEVDYLNGEIVRLAGSCGIDAPLNRRVVELVHAAERDGRGPPGLGADALWRALSSKAAASATTLSS